MKDENDWRLMAQEKFLVNKELVYVPNYIAYSEKWDHEHCSFCFAKISRMDGDLHQGYCTNDKKFWICTNCYKDFKDKLNWSVSK